jgi:hypothetical protein
MSVPVKIERGRGKRYAEYVDLVSAPFSGSLFNELHDHYYKVRTSKVVENFATRGGTTRRAEVLIKPWSMIDRVSPGAKEQLDHCLAVGDRETGLKVMRALRYFDKYPHSLTGGPKPPWHTCLLHAGEVTDVREIIDVSTDVIDVEAVVMEIVLTRVVKAELGTEEATSKPQAVQRRQQPVVKLENGTVPEPTQSAVLGIKVRRRFPGYGLYDGEVVRCHDDRGKVEIEWHDGTRTTMGMHELRKCALNSGDVSATLPAAHIGPGIEPESQASAREPKSAKTSRGLGFGALPMKALEVIASFSPPPAVYSLCLSSQGFHVSIGDASGKAGDHKLLATRLLRFSLLASLNNVMAHQTRMLKLRYDTVGDDDEESLDDDEEKGEENLNCNKESKLRGYPTVATLEAICAVNAGKKAPAVLISGSSMVQTVLGEIWNPLVNVQAYPKTGIVRKVLDSSGGVVDEFAERDFSHPKTVLRPVNAVQDLDVFCTAASAPAVRTALVNSGYWLAGFPDDYELDHSPTFMMDSCIHRVEGYSPWKNDGNQHCYDPDHVDRYISDEDRDNFSSFDQAAHNAALQFGEALGRFPTFPGCASWPDDDVALKDSRSFRRKARVPLEGSSGETIPFDNDQYSKVLDLVVAGPLCTDAKVLLDGFDIVICKASFVEQSSAYLIPI